MLSWQPVDQAKTDSRALEEIADADINNPTYVSRVLRMTLLAPEIVEALVAGRQREELTMASALKPFPIERQAQRHGLLPASSKMGSAVASTAEIC